MTEGSDPINYLSTDDILAIHELIVESNEDTESGVSSPGDVEYATEDIREGHFGRVPESVDEKAFQLLRLIVANHPFVDGNKRTALMSTRIFYALNGLEFAYDRRIKDILKRVATDETSVEKEVVLSYLDDHTEPLEPEYRTTIELWLSRIADADRIPENIVSDPPEGENHSKPNDYDAESRSEE
ncbi:type II toxin-antitoxin system death-on-curing family toxin [Halomicrobium mukohataei]|uniref:Death-on-curing family protein n=2 Tax=Halomicrobium mukohataei TaxID=57705 RepID=C7P4Z7_HALMD|nr:Fic family protein [Halomicrobium mukohataei]ACV49392.1 death-on-curing family protein [Halomicrobium mukohataei DSM 12286]QCD67220.1 Fic family protein [Halomicrobium mukohataei]